MCILYVKTDCAFAINMIDNLEKLKNKKCGLLILQHMAINDVTVVS